MVKGGIVIHKIVNQKVPTLKDQLEVKHEGSENKIFIFIYLNTNGINIKKIQKVYFYKKV